MSRYQSRHIYEIVCYYQVLPVYKYRTYILLVNTALARQ